MPRFLFLLPLIAGLGACHLIRAQSDNRISFFESDDTGHEVRRLSFVLAEEPARTCISGEWKRAKAVDDRARYTQNPAYTLEGGRLQVLLVNSMCDAYDSYVGNLADGQFHGDHVAYGLGYSKVLGTVSGTSLPSTNHGAR